MNKTVLIEKLWRECCEEHPEINPNEPYQVWFFGNSSEMAKELAELVISGKKTASGS